MVTKAKPRARSQREPSASPLNSATRMLAGTVCLLYLAALLAFFVARALLSEPPPVLALLNSFVPFLFAPLLLILPAAFWLRWRVLGGLALCAVALFLWLYGAQFFPRVGAEPNSNLPLLKAMTFNLGADCCAPEPLIAAIESESPDLVAVQELTTATTALITSRLSARYPQMILQPYGGTTGLLNPYPIVKREWFQPGGRGRMALYAVLNVQGVRLHVFVAHLVPPDLTRDEEYRLPIGLQDQDRALQVTDIARRVAAISGPTLLLGDFNMSDQSRAYAVLRKTLSDSYQEAGWGFGFTFPHGVHFHGLPVPGPLVRIDYVLHSTQLYARRARVNCDRGSDHCYLTTDFLFR